MEKTTDTASHSKRRKIVVVTKKHQQSLRDTILFSPTYFGIVIEFLSIHDIFTNIRLINKYYNQFIDAKPNRNIMFHILVVQFGGKTGENSECAKRKIWQPLNLRNDVKISKIIELAFTDIEKLWLDCIVNDDVVEQILLEGDPGEILGFLCFYKLYPAVKIWFKKFVVKGKNDGGGLRDYLLLSVLKEVVIMSEENAKDMLFFIDKLLNKHFIDCEFILFDSCFVRIFLSSVRIRKDYKWLGNYYKYILPFFKNFEYCAFSNFVLGFKGFVYDIRFYDIINENMVYSLETALKFDQKICNKLPQWAPFEWGTMNADLKKRIVNCFRFLLFHVLENLM